VKQPTFGLPAEGKKRWCGGCAKAHAGAVDVHSKKCEGCGLKKPIFGLPAEEKKRWCSGCAQGHAGAEDLVNKKCEGCGLKQRTFGLPSEGKKRRWCAGCAPKAANPGGRRKKAGGAPQKKAKVTNPPLTSVRGKILHGDGNPY
jgi:hypothetical protein